MLNIINYYKLHILLNFNINNSAMNYHKNVCINLL